MKKILALSIGLVLLTVAASAQVRSSDGIRNRRANVTHREVTRPEKRELRKDAFRYDRMRHKSRRDGRVSPMERRRLHQAKRHQRVDRHRFRHNSRRRVI